MCFRLGVLISIKQGLEFVVNLKQHVKGKPVQMQIAEICRCKLCVKHLDTSLSKLCVGGVGFIQHFLFVW